MRRCWCPLEWDISCLMSSHILCGSETYEKLRDDVFGKESDGSFPVYKAALAGFIAGGVAQVSANPMDLVKVQLQMNGKRQLQYRSTDVFKTLLKIWKDAGIRGLWRGWVPNAQRGALVNLGDIATYDSAKRLILEKTNMKDGIALHIVSSFLAGLAVTVLATPMEVVATRIMNQPTKNEKGLYYKNSIDCLHKTVANEGILAIYKGFMPMWMRMGPASLIFWVVLERIRGTFGMSSF